jgi:hypothetical protein
MASQCLLLSSFTLDLLKLTTSDLNAYHLPPTVTADGPVPSGPLLLKLIISQAHVNSRATVSFIRTSLTKLDAKVIELNSNIESFNLYIKAQVKSFSARRETYSNLLINLFKGYKAADDSKLLDFIRCKKNASEEGEDINTNNRIAPDALVKFKVRKLVKKWFAPTKKQGQIFALTAHVEQLKSAKQLSNQGPNTSPNRPETTKRDNK